MVVTVTGENAIVTLGDPGMAHVSVASAIATVSDRENPLRVSQAQMISLHSDRTNDLRVTLVNAYVLLSLKAAPEPPKPVFPPRGKVELNPYRPYLPSELDADPVLGRFMKEQIETLRRQHNLIQAGDTTYPWEVLTEVNDSREFTLGSMGRFYHPQFGLVVARYVQFGKIVETNWLAAPVGWQNDATLVDWIVTNDLSQSDPEMACGVTACYTLPVEGKFGWMITQGANLVSLNALASQPGKQGQEYVWSGSGTISTTGKGKVIGRLWGTRSDVNIPAGAMFIDVEGLSSESQRARLSAELDQIAAQLTAMAAQIAELDEYVSSTDDHEAIVAQGRRITSLLERLEREERARANGDERLQRAIDAIGGNENALENLRNDLINMINKSAGDQQVDIDKAIARANAAYALVAAIDPAGIYSRLDAMDNALGDLGNRLTGFSVLMDSNTALPGQMLVWRINRHDPDTGLNYGSFHLEDPPGSDISPGVLPVVTGDVPPILVYLDDGSLVYSEV